MSEERKRMLVMPSNNVGFEAGRLFERYPDRLAHLHSPSAKKEPKPGVPWALDNGIFGAWDSGTEWSEEPFYKYLETFAAWRPLWAVVPDSVGNREETLERWKQHRDAVAAFGVPLAFAVQDGMSVEDVPEGVDVVFVGGSTSWKWRSLRMWTENFPRVHVGRVNSYEALWQCDTAGAESCDGTGWFRDPSRKDKVQALVSYLEESKGPHPQRELL